MSILAGISGSKGSKYSKLKQKYDKTSNDISGARNNIFKLAQAFEEYESTRRKLTEQCLKDTGYKPTDKNTDLTKIEMNILYQKLLSYAENVDKEAKKIGSWIKNYDPTGDIAHSKESLIARQKELLKTSGKIKGTIYKYTNGLEDAKIKYLNTVQDIMNVKGVLDVPKDKYIIDPKIFSRKYANSLPKLEARQEKMEKDLAMLKNLQTELMATNKK